MIDPFTPYLDPLTPASLSRLVDYSAAKRAEAASPKHAERELHEILAAGGSSRLNVGV